MLRKRASEIFREVDPDLRVIDANPQRRRKEREEEEVDQAPLPAPVAHYTTFEDWLAAGGVKCPGCDQETVRLRPRDNLCPRCSELSDAKEIRDEKKQARIAKFRKRHNARIKKGG